MKRKTCFYKWLVAVVVLICSTTTMSAQIKVTSVNQLKAGCVIKIYPKDKFGYSDEALACSGDGQSLNLYCLAGSGDEWTLEDAGDGSCYIKNDKGCYWAYQVNPAKRNVLDLKNETCKNLEKRNVLKKSRTRHFKAIKKQSKTGCFYSF